MSGWISIERDLFKNEFFANEPMSEREAWVWMIAQAAYTDTRHRVGGVMLPVPRGSFMHTLRELMVAFGWNSDTKVRNFLKRLENDEMITREVVGSRNAPKTHVTIRNYNEYQSYGRTENAPETHEKRTKNVVKKQGNKVTIEDTNVSSAPSAPKKPKATGTRLPDDWYLSKHLGEWSISEGATIDLVRIEADKFRDYWIGVAGAKGRKADWDATWRNWIRRAIADTAPRLRQINGSGQDRSRMIIKAAATGTTQQDWG